jgi:acid phosphatase
MGIIFYSIGDWGKRTKGLFATAKSMGSSSEVKKPDFILSLGDNFYPDGVTSTTDEKWESTWRRIFVHPNLFCPWYSILGNHDYILNPQAQIDYYKEKKDTRWIMPSRYYHFTKTFGDKTLQVICLDTVELDLISTQYLLPKSVIRREQLSQSKSDSQLAWLEETLINSTADWLIVTGHYNMYTGGWHGSNRNLINMLKPIFINYKVDMYFAGHCHNLEHLSDSGIEYIISGSGAKTGRTVQIYQRKFRNLSTYAEIYNGNNEYYKFDLVVFGEYYKFTGQVINCGYSYQVIS